jgi:pimeloyl-ACP methyl ester carboxylesterase
VLTVTLTGIAERAHLLHAGVNLQTHVEHVLAELAVHSITDAVLVGHGYGGMVITAVADRVPQQVNSLVYLDAFVPRDGESCWTLTTDEQRECSPRNGRASRHSQRRSSESGMTGTGPRTFSTAHTT